MTLSRIDLCHRGEQRERLCRTTDLFLCTVWSNTTEWRHKCNHILGFIHFSVGICSLCVRWTFGVKPTENPLCTRPSKAGQAQWLFCFLNGDIVAWVQQATSVTGHEQHEIHQHTYPLLSLGSRLLLFSAVWKKKRQVISVQTTLSGSPQR